jgi:hypothetical protein
VTPKNEDYTEINNQIVNTLVQDDSKTDSVEDEDNLGEELYPIEFLNSLQFAVARLQFHCNHATVN